MAVNALVAAVSYLRGSLDFAVLVSRRRGVYIYSVRSGSSRGSEPQIVSHGR
ncbi:MAG: hypothetical protein ACE5MI_06980 [Acidimicrobiia bacterium]